MYCALGLINELKLKLNIIGTLKALKKYIANNLAPFQLSQKYFVLS
jgi:hypothetical protein